MTPPFLLRLLLTVLASLPLMSCTSVSEKLKVWEEVHFDAQRAQREGRVEAAEKLFILAVEEARQFGANSLQLAISLERLAQLHLKKGDQKQAQALLLQALSVYEHLASRPGTLQKEKSDRLFQKEYAHTERLLGDLYRESRNDDLAVKHYSRAVTLSDNILKDKSYSGQDTLVIADLITSLNGLAEMHARSGKKEEARKLSDRAFERSRFYGFPTDKLVQFESETLSKTSSAAGAASGSDRVEILDLWNEHINEAKQYMKNESYPSAEASLRLALVEARKLGKDDTHFMQTLSDLLRVLTREKKYNDAETYLPEAQSLVDTQPNSKEMDNLLGNMVRIYDRGNQSAKAEAALKKRLVLREEIRGAESPHVAEVLKDLARFYLKHDRLREAEQAQTRALKLVKQDSGTEPRMIVEMEDLLARIKNAK